MSQSDSSIHIEQRFGFDGGFQVWIGPDAVLYERWRAADPDDPPVKPAPSFALSELQAGALVVEILRGPIGPTGPMGPMGRVADG